MEKDQWYAAVATPRKNQKRWPNRRCSIADELKRSFLVNDKNNNSKRSNQKKNKKKKWDDVANVLESKSTMRNVAPIFPLCYAATAHESDENEKKNRLQQTKWWQNPIDTMGLCMVHLDRLECHLLLINEHNCSPTRPRCVNLRENVVAWHALGEYCLCWKPWEWH